jgi:hypothetical protein
MGCLPKRFEQRRQRRFRGARTLRVTAHAVDDGQQYRMFVGRNPDAILIFFAVTDQAHIRGFDLQLLLLSLLLDLNTILCRTWPIMPQTLHDP